MRCVALHRAWLALAGLWIACDPLQVANAATPQIFPVKSHLVPVLVAAVFMLPATFAGCLSLMRRVGRGRAIAGVGVAAAVVWVALYGEPSWLTALRV